MTMTCGNCLYGAEIFGDEELRSCRRFPPVVYKVEQTAEGRWAISSYNPVVSRVFWCGEWKSEDMAEAVSASTVLSSRRRK